MFVESIFDVLLARFSQRGHVLIMPFVHAWEVFLKVLCSLIKWCLGVPSSLIKFIFHIICFQTLKVKSLKLDKFSCFLCYCSSWMYICLSIVIELMVFPISLLLSFAYQYFIPSCLWVFDKGYFTALCPTLLTNLMSISLHT